MKTLQVYNNRVLGAEVSEYGLENGYLDYRTIVRIIGDCILNNEIFQYAGYENWELESGEELSEDGDYYEVYQYFIINDFGARFLKEYTDELVYYHADLGMYLWGVTHFGTSWDYVLSDIALEMEAN